LYHDFTTKGQNNSLQEAPPGAPPAAVLLWNPALNSASQVCVTNYNNHHNCYSILFLICISTPTTTTTTTTNYLFFLKILSFLCMMKNEWASLSYDFSVCILTVTTSFISKEEDTFLTATWRNRVNQDPPVHSPLDAIMTQLWMNIKWVWYLVPSCVTHSVSVFGYHVIRWICFAPRKQGNFKSKLLATFEMWVILKLNCSWHLKCGQFFFWNVGNFVLKLHCPS
jgi:hypothetical protein